MSETKQSASEKKSVMAKLRYFVADTIAEMGRCTWPSKQQLWESTILIVVAIIVLAGFVAGVDEIARRVINLITIGKF